MAWMDDLAGHAHKSLDERVRDALAMRGVTDAQIDHYGVGYIDGKLPDTYEIPVPFRAWCQGGRKLQDSYVFPLTNTLGVVRGFQFRSVDRQAKRYSDYFEDERQPEAIFFGLAQAMPHVWEHESIFLVEGPFDLFPIQSVFPGIVATLTARVTEPLIRVMKRLVKDVWMGYDNDPPGRQGCARFMKEHGKDFNCHDVVYPKTAFYDGRVSKDPCDLWEAWGQDGLGKFVRSVTGAV